VAGAKAHSISDGLWRGCSRALPQKPIVLKAKSRDLKTNASTQFRWSGGIGSNDDVGRPYGRDGDGRGDEP
jgi:hypothetical protein